MSSRTDELLALLSAMAGRFDWPTIEPASVKVLADWLDEYAPDNPRFGCNPDGRWIDRKRRQRWVSTDTRPLGARLIYSGYSDVYSSMMNWWFARNSSLLGYVFIEQVQAFAIHVAKLRTNTDWQFLWNALTEFAIAVDGIPAFHRLNTGEPQIGLVFPKDPFVIAREE